MRRQAHRLSSWGQNVFVKIPVTNTEGISSSPPIADLTADGLHLNVTGILSLAQVRTVAESLSHSSGAVVSVFAGRIADTGRDPVPLMAATVELLHPYPNLELLWASPREVLNVCQAESVGCQIITVTHELLKKLGGLGRSLEEVSLDTVKMFYRDAVDAATSCSCTWSAHDGNETIRDPRPESALEDSGRFGVNLGSSPRCRKAPAVSRLPANFVS